MTSLGHAFRSLSLLFISLTLYFLIFSKYRVEMSLERIWMQNLNTMLGQILCYLTPRVLMLGTPSSESWMMGGNRSQMLLFSSIAWKEQRRDPLYSGMLYHSPVMKILWALLSRFLCMLDADITGIYNFSSPSLFWKTRFESMKCSLNCSYISSAGTKYWLPNNWSTRAMILGDPSHITTIVCSGQI